MDGGRAGLLPAALAMAIAAPAEAGETVTYSYDALGRLTATSTTGTVNNGTATGIGYDAAGNRSSYSVTGAGGGAPPPPPPPPGNQPPVAVADTADILQCASQNLFIVLDNDYDPDGHTPLELIAVSYNGGLGTASLAEPRIRFMPNGSGFGTAAVAYTVRDSLGATATGTLSIEVQPC